MIVPPLNGGEDFAGKSGRKTANACETNAMETSVIAAAHFPSNAIDYAKFYNCSHNRDAHRKEKMQRDDLALRH